MFLNDMSTIVRYSNVFMNRSLTHENITSAENYILLYLFSNKESTQDDIAAYLTVDKGSISKSINNLEQKGYVYKQSNPKNRRENIISLSELGINTFSKNEQLLSKWHTSVMDGITKEEFAVLKRIVSKMADNAKQAIDTLDE